MKRLLLALAIATASFVVFTSCTKEYITQEHYDMVPAQTMVYERSAADWEGSGQQKFLDLSVQEITSYYINQGIVTVALSFNNEQTYQALPATIEGVSYSFEYTVGRVTIFAEDPIMAGENIPIPTNAVFKISLIDADWVE